MKIFLLVCLLGVGLAEEDQEERYWDKENLEKDNLDREDLEEGNLDTEDKEKEGSKDYTVWMDASQPN
jgi:hypothetical protein